MRKSNIKTPLIFRIALILLCVMLLTFSMMGDLYARYVSIFSGDSSTNVAQISYKITPLVTNNQDNLSVHQIDVNTIPPGCKAIAIEETFTLENDGDVSYDYELILSLKDQNGNNLSAISLITFDTKAWVPPYKGESEKELTLLNNKFYYSLDSGATWLYSDSPTLKGTLKYGESVTYTILYFIDFSTESNDEMMKKNVLKYNITCSQID